MDKKQLGNSDMEITPIGLGTWAIGGLGYQYSWGPQDDQDSIKAIHRGLDLGINWIDTAAGYGLGHSEEVIGRALEEWSGSRPYLFTKCGLRTDDDGSIHNDLGPDSLRKECEDSLRRLKVEAIDLYQIHWPTDVPGENEEGWETLAALQKEGKVRWIGLSNFSVEQMQSAQEIATITSLQPPYSLIRREIEEAILPYCLEKGIGVIPYSPMFSGLLTGKMTKERAASLPDNDWRGKDPEFLEPKLSKNLVLVECLKEIGATQGRSAGEVAIAWTLLHPAITGTIVGVRSESQVDGIIGAVDVEFNKDDLAKIESLLG
jgi:aryl-alcohol dehydrogenase-like predicted oxidoreductase